MQSRVIQNKDSTGIISLLHRSTVFSSFPPFLTFSHTHQCLTFSHTHQCSDVLILRAHSLRHRQAVSVAIPTDSVHHLRGGRYYFTHYNIICDINLAKYSSLVVNAMHRMNVQRGTKGHRVITSGFRLPIGNDKAGFTPFSIPCSGFRAQFSVILKNREKSAPIRPVAEIPPKK